MPFVTNNMTSREEPPQKKRKTDEDKPLSPRLKAALKRTGTTAGHDAMRLAVEKVTRNELFEQIKFVSPAEMASNGQISLYIKTKLAGGRIDTKNWSGVWEEWVKKAVTVQINKRRNTVLSAIMTETRAREY